MGSAEARMESKTPQGRGLVAPRARKLRGGPSVASLRRRAAEARDFPTRPRPYAAFEPAPEDYRTIGDSGVLRYPTGLPYWDGNPRMAPIFARGLGVDHGVFHEMSRSDGAIAGVDALTTREVSGAKYEVITPSNPTALEGQAAELVARYTGLDGTPGWLVGGWRRHARQACRQFRYGFSAFETTWEPRQWGGRTVVVPVRVEWRAPWSVTGWLWQGGRLVGMRQAAPGALRANPYGSEGWPVSLPSVTIPANKLLLYTHNGGGDGNPEGDSMLRPAWVFWRWKKDTIIRNQEAEDRLFGGVSILSEVGDGNGNPIDSISELDQQQFEDAFEALVTGGLEWITMPLGWEMNQSHPSFQIPSRVDELMYCDRQIFLALAAVLLGLDASHAGSKNLSDGLGALLWRALASAADEVVDPFNGLEGVEETGIIRKIVDANFDVPADFRYPRIQHVGLEYREFESYIRGFVNAYEGGAMTRQPEDEEYLRARYDLPSLGEGVRDRLDAAFAAERAIHA